MRRNREENTGVFACVCCGDCCRGSGGIVLRRSDITRLATHLGLTESAMLARYAEEKNGKFRLRSHSDGSCLFWDEAVSCTVHPAKPDICRAWPFFRGNLEDAVSLGMAREACPGLVTEAAHESFAQAGAAWLLEHGLYRDKGESDAPGAMMTRDELAALRKKR